MANAGKIDPFDVEALEKSLNDSATRVSTIWVSFLIFSLYLLTAATTVTHRQLFLAEPIRLPVLNIDLPLWGFFWLAPILFVVFHAYVLIQLILLARTAAAYDAAVAKLAQQENLSPEANTALRQRLANTLFAQIFAGSPREREGWFGSLLKAMAWITLVIAPILILLTFQFMFLPYHSHLATWTHRLLILLEFVVAFQLWPLALNPQRDFRWPDWQSGKIAVRAKGFLRSSERRRRARRGLRRVALPIAATALFILLSLSLATFPGEPHVNLFTGQAIDDVRCKRWIQQKFDSIDLRFDRLSLARADVVDHDKLEKIQQATSKAGERPYQGERTRILRNRDLNCGDFSEYADLRRIDLSGAHLRNADFRYSKLEGISFAGSQLQGAFLDNAQLQGASLLDAQLQGASLDFAQLQGVSLNKAELRLASLISAQLQGASVDGARLQGALLNLGKLQGASLNNAQLQGASLDGAELQGASLKNAQLQGASLSYVQLQGASLNGAQLQGAFLDGALLQGTTLSGADLGNANLSHAWIWGARDMECDNARIVRSKKEAFIGERRINERYEPIPATTDGIKDFIMQSTAGIQDPDIKEQVSRILRERLTVDPAKDESAALVDIWRGCEVKSGRVSKLEFDNRLLTVLRTAVCDAEIDSAAIARGVVRNWILSDERFEFKSSLAGALLGEHGKSCAAAGDYDDRTKRLLRGFANHADGASPELK